MSSTPDKREPVNVLGKTGEALCPPAEYCKFAPPELAHRMDEPQSSARRLMRALEQHRFSVSALVNAAYLLADFMTGTGDAAAARFKPKERLTRRPLAAFGTIAAAPLARTGTPGGAA